jgi:two-component system, LuxR family, response regulator FixJ
MLPRVSEIPPTIFIVDDDPLVCARIEALLSGAGLACESFQSAREFLQSFDPQRPGCLVCDVRMPEMSGLDLQRELNALGAPLTLIFITGQGDIPTAVAAMRNGALDFLLKPLTQTGLLVCVQKALERDRDMRHSLAEITHIRERYGLLSEREREVLGYLVKGASNKVMAHELGIAQRTVELHRCNVMTKMSARSLAELVRMVMNLERADAASVNK